MPSKYSHSVVLAQQSSCGLISLPNDQYIEYLKSSPLLTTKPPPQTRTAAPPKNRARAISTKSNGSERLAVQNSLRQQSSFDQLAADAYQHQPSTRRLHRRPRHVILDFEEKDDDESADIESRSETGPAGHGVLQARNRIPTAFAHNRDVSIPRSLSTPQLSPTGSEMTRQEDSPATPFSSRERGRTPAMADGQRNNLSSESSLMSQDTRIFRPAAVKMPSQANFDGFFDGIESGRSYFEDLPEPAETRKLRLMNMRAHNAMAKAINDSPRKENYGFGKNPPAVSNRISGLQPPPQKRYRHRLDSLSSMSSVSDFGIPSVSQTTGKPKTSAAAMQIEYPITAHQALLGASKRQPKAPTSNRQNQPSAPPQTKSTTLSSPFAGPSIPHSPSKRHVDSSLLALAAPSPHIDLSQFLSGLESRFSDSADDDDDAAAAPPPDIARHPHTVHHDPLSQLVIDSRGGVATLTTVGHQQQQRPRTKSFSRALEFEPQGQGQERKGGVFSSLRLKGKKW